MARNPANDSAPGRGLTVMFVVVLVIAAFGVVRPDVPWWSRCGAGVVLVINGALFVRETRRARPRRVPVPGIAHREEARDDHD